MPYRAPVEAQRSRNRRSTRIMVRQKRQIRVDKRQEVPNLGRGKRYWTDDHNIDPRVAKSVGNLTGLLVIENGLYSVQQDVGMLPNPLTLN